MTTALDKFKTAAAMPVLAAALTFNPATSQDAEAAMVTLDFEQFAAQTVGASVVDLSDTISEDGFTLTATNDFDLPFRTIGDQVISYTGSAAIAPLSIDNITTLTKDGGGAFGIISIDLEKPSPSEPTASFTFNGLTSGGQTVSQTFDLVGMPDFVLDTFYFNNNFDNIVSLTWQEGSNLQNYAQFDNIVLNDTVVSTPIPGAALLLGSALAGLAGFSARQRSNTSSLSL